MWRATAFKIGTVPADPVNTGKAMVKERFGTSNVYFVLDKLIVEWICGICYFPVSGMDSEICFYQ